MVKGGDVRVPTGFPREPAANPSAMMPTILLFPGPLSNASPSTVQSPYEPELKSSMRMMSSAFSGSPVIMHATMEQHTIPVEIALSRPIADSPPPAISAEILTFFLIKESTPAQSFTSTTQRNPIVEERSKPGQTNSIFVARFEGCGPPFTYQPEPSAPKYEPPRIREYRVRPSSVCSLSVHSQVLPHMS